MLHRLARTGARLAKQLAGLTQSLQRDARLRTGLHRRMRWRSHDNQFVLQPRRDIKLRFVARPFDQADVDLQSGDGRSDRRAGNDDTNALPRGGIVIPWFALGFVAVAGLNSLALLHYSVVTLAINIDTVLLAMAMAGLGLTTHVSAIRKADIKPLALAAVLFVWLVCGGFAINAGITALVT